MDRAETHSLTYFPPLESEGHSLAHEVTTCTNSHDGMDIVVTDQVENISQPPSPPESGAVSPLLRIGPCPMRLAPIIPPPNYGAVEQGSVFRSAFPQDRNLGFLKILGVRSVLCLVQSAATAGYEQWLTHGDIKHTRLYIEPNKDGKVHTTWDSLCHALLIIMDPSNQPVYIHCNQGRHRTGCVVACLRKVQRWHIDDIIAEYETYAAPKARTGDLDLIRAFDPEAVYRYSQKHDYFTGRHFMHRSDSIISNIDTLVAALRQADTYDDQEVAVLSNTTSMSDESDDMMIMVDSQASTRRDPAAHYHSASEFLPEE